MSCDARIKPFPNDTVLTCELPAAHPGMHESTLRDYAYPGSETVVSWAEDDRRTFRGDWIECVQPNCILPANHRGNHAF